MQCEQQRQLHSAAWSTMAQTQVPLTYHEDQWAWLCTQLGRAHCMAGMASMESIEVGNQLGDRSKVCSQAISR